MNDYVSRQAVIDYLMINMGWHDEDDREIDDWDEKKPIITDLINGVPSGWISVKDRLPERYERILTYDKYSGVKENWLLKSDPCVSWSYGFHVTHWMPLPEPPKEDSKNRI